MAVSGIMDITVPRFAGSPRGKRKEIEDDGVPSILEADKGSKEYRKNGPRLLQKIYEIDPLTCPKCHGQMQIIAFLENEQLIKKTSSILDFGK